MPFRRARARLPRTLTAPHSATDVDRTVDAVGRLPTSGG